jgi:hypothetical protein
MVLWLLLSLLSHNACVRLVGRRFLGPMSGITDTPLLSFYVYLYIEHYTH